MAVLLFSPFLIQPHSAPYSSSNIQQPGLHFRNDYSAWNSLPPGIYLITSLISLRTLLTSLLLHDDYSSSCLLCPFDISFCFLITFILSGIRSYTRLTPYFVFSSSQAFIKVLGPCIIQCVDIVDHKEWHRREEMPIFNPPLTPAWGNSYLSQRIIIQNSRHLQCLHKLLYILDSICFHKCIIKWIKI